MTIPNPLALIAGKVGSVIDAIGGVLDKVSTTEEEKLALKADLLKIRADAEIELAKVDAQFAEARAKVLVAEAQSESWLTRNWRPITMLVLVYVILHTYVFVPLFGIPEVTVPEAIWEIIKLGLTGYIVGRSVENVASYIPDAVAAIRPGSPQQ